MATVEKIIFPAFIPVNFNLSLSNKDSSPLCSLLEFFKFYHLIIFFLFLYNRNIITEKPINVG